MKKLFGTVVPIITPLTEDDKIDVASLKNLTDHCINNGLQCLYPCGTTGEMMYLTVAERKLVAETVVSHAAKRVPVFVQVGAWNLADTIELAKHAVSIGADGIGVVTPVFYKLSDQGLVDFYKAVSSSVPADFPVYLYSIPQNAINDISPSTAARIAELCPNVVGIKYSYPGHHGRERKGGGKQDKPNHGPHDSGVQQRRGELPIFFGAQQQYSVGPEYQVESSHARHAVEHTVRPIKCIFQRQRDHPTVWEDGGSPQDFLSPFIRV